MEQDHYKTLGVSRSASKEEIKTAFRKSAMEYHPDRHAQSSAGIRASAAAKFRKVSEAYETLIDARRRSDYDSRLRTGTTGSSGSGNYSYNRTSTSTSSASGSYSRYSWSSSSGSRGGEGGTANGHSWSYSWSSGPSGAGGGGGGGTGTTGGYYKAGNGGGMSETGWQYLQRVMTTRQFLIGIGCVSILVGSALLIEVAIERAWKKNNSGKSFEEAMEALEKARVEKDGGH